MPWFIFAIAAMGTAAAADLFRKIGAQISDPFVANLFSQIGSLSMAVILYLFFSRKLVDNPSGISSALLAGVFISISTALFFKSLSLGPGVATVSPTIRIGGVLLVVIFGLILFREKLTWNLITGILLTSTGLYLLFLNK